MRPDCFCDKLNIKFLFGHKINKVSPTKIVKFLTYQNAWAKSFLRRFK
jgi:hypothetical protein